MHIFLNAGVSFQNAVTALSYVANFHACPPYLVPIFSVGVLCDTFLQNQRKPFKGNLHSTERIRTPTT